MGASTESISLVEFDDATPNRCKVVSQVEVERLLKVYGCLLGKDNLVSRSPGAHIKVLGVDGDELWWKAEDVKHGC